MDNTSTFINGVIVNSEAKKSANGNSMVVFTVSIDENKKPRRVFVMKNEEMLERVNKMLGADYKTIDEIVKVVRKKSLIGTQVSCLMVEDSFINENKETITYLKLASFYPSFKKETIDATPVDNEDMPF